MGTRVSWLLLVAVAATANGCATAAAAGSATQPSKSINVLAMGDWGEDTAAQRQVAAAMAKFVLPDDDLGSFKAVILCGDNFYFRLTGVDDPRWKTLFEQMYDPKTLNIPFYACLGNHDYDGNNFQSELGYAQRHPDSRFKMPAPWYRVDLPAVKPMLTLLMLDSNKDAMTEVQWSQQIQWLKKQLSGPRADWTICCAHHPMFSNGFFFFNGILQRDWGALFEKYHVDFYLAGHEHNLQHLEIPSWKESFVIAGGGGAHPHPLFRADRGFSREQFGFVDFELTPDKAIVRFIGTDGTPIHEFERAKAGAVKVLMTIGNSTPEKNALKAYLELRNRTAATQP